MDTLSRPSETDEVHDLQLVLLASGVISVVLASVVILAEQTGVLDIPAAETLLLCGLAGAIASVAVIIGSTGAVVAAAIPTAPRAPAARLPGAPGSRTKAAA